MNICILTLVMLITTASTASAWTWTADFEDGVIGNDATGTSGFSTVEYANQIVYDNTQARGSKSALFPWEEGLSGFAEYSGGITYPSHVGQGGDIWIRVYYFFDSGWQWTNTGIKILRNNNVEAGFNSIFTRGTTGPIRISTEGAEVDEETNSGVNFDINAWQSIELYIHNSSVTGEGILRVWKNGILVIEDASGSDCTADFCVDSADHTLGSSSDYSDFAFLMSQWNDGVPRDQNMWVDDIIVTNETPASQDAYGNYMIGPESSTTTRTIIRGTYR